MIGIGYESQGLYHMSKSPSLVAFTSATLTDLLHNRLGHLSLIKLPKLIPSLSTLSSFVCESYQLGKHSCTSFSKRFNNRATYYVCHCSLRCMGSQSCCFNFRISVFVISIDDFFCCTWVFLMNNLSEVLFKKLVLR